MEKRTRTDEIEEDIDGDEFGGTAFAMMPDGLPGPIDALLPPPSVPDRHPDVFVCLRGPCRHYWTLKTMAGEGNPEGTFSKPKLKVHHVCLVNPGMETAFEDDNVYECNQWDPESLSTRHDRDARRRNYFSDHPEHELKEEDDARDEQQDPHESGHKADGGLPPIPETTGG